MSAAKELSQQSPPKPTTVAAKGHGEGRTGIGIRQQPLDGYQHLFDSQCTAPLISQYVQVHDTVARPDVAMVDSGDEPHLKTKK